MTNELYTKLLQVLTLGHIMYLDSLGKLEKPEQFAVCYELRNMYEPDDMVAVIREFIRWYKDLEVEDD